MLTIIYFKSFVIWINSVHVFTSTSKILSVFTGTPISFIIYPKAYCSWEQFRFFLCSCVYSRSFTVHFLVIDWNTEGAASVLGAWRRHVSCLSWKGLKGPQLSRAPQTLFPTLITLYTGISKIHTTPCYFHGQFKLPPPPTDKLHTQIINSWKYCAILSGKRRQVIVKT